MELPQFSRFCRSSSVQLGYFMICSNNPEIGLTEGVE
jgi:hypothetical protein